VVVLPWSFVWPAFLHDCSFALCTRIPNDDSSDDDEEAYEEVVRRPVERKPAHPQNGSKPKNEKENASPTPPQKNGPEPAAPAQNGRPKPRNSKLEAKPAPPQKSLKPRRPKLEARHIPSPAGSKRQESKEKVEESRPSMPAAPIATDGGTTVDYLCFLDFMATCNDGPPPKPQEIIEFPALLLNVKTGEIEDTFHHYIKPDVHPQLAPFCTELTGITQDMVDAGVSLEEALVLHQQWLDRHNIVSAGDEASENEEKKRFLYVTCGDWDLKVCLPNQLEYHERHVPEGFGSWINVKWPFENMYHSKPRGIADMMSQMGLIVADGSYQSGIDDCQNLARICATMLSHGWTATATAGIGRVGTRKFWMVQSKQKWPPQPDPVSPYKMVYLIRHAQSEGQVVSRKARGSDQSLKDCGLTKIGCKEARRLSELFTAEQMESIKLVISSPLKRALHTSILGFTNHKVLVHYDLAEVGRDIPENSAKPMDEVLEDIDDAMIRRGKSAELDYLSLQPKGWPNSQFEEARVRRIRKAFEWMYVERKEKVFAVVCHHNVMRTAIYGATSPSSPENATPIKCQLFISGNLVPV
jgi:ERI1 exoribonuclease 3